MFLKGSQYKPLIRRLLREFQHALALVSKLPGTTILIRQRTRHSSPNRNEVFQARFALCRSVRRYEFEFAGGFVPEPVQLCDDGLQLRLLGLLKLRHVDSFFATL